MKIQLLVSIALSLAPSFGQSIGNQTIGNLSIRGQVSSSEQFISGFVIQGGTSTAILIRGAGPALIPFGIGTALQKPILTLYDSRGQKVAENVGWNTRPSDEWSAIGRRSTTFAFSDNSDDCGMLVTLAPGLYTVQLGGVNGSSGIGLIELYHGNGFGTAPQSSTHLINVSSRCLVGAGDAIAIAGLSLPMGRRLLIRAIGPTLTQFGVRGVLTNPKLEIVRPAIATSFIGGGISTLPAVVVFSNDDWNEQKPLTLGADPQTGALRPIVGVSWSGSVEEIRTATVNSGAFSIADGEKDAAVLVSINYSPMTVQVSDSNGGTGVALVEVYDVDALPQSQPNKVPELTTMSITPRAIEGVSK